MLVEQYAHWDSYVWVRCETIEGNDTRLVPLVGEVDASVEMSASYGVTNDYSKTFSQVLTKSVSKTESQTQGTNITTSIPVDPQTVLYHDILTYSGTHDAPISIDYSVRGNFSFTLNNGQSYTVPINAILQHYDLKDGTLNTFNPAENANLLGTDFDGNGTSLYYANQLNFTQKN